MDPLAPTATPQEAFVLMLHDRLVAAEERICALTAELDRRAPPRLASPERMIVQHATRGCFFSFLAAPGTWPAYTDEKAQEEVAKRLVGALIGLYDGEAGHTSAAFCQAPLAEARAHDVATTVAIMNAIPCMTGEGALSAAEISAAIPEGTLVEGVISSAAPGFSMHAAALALEEAFGATWMLPDTTPGADRSIVDQAVWGIVSSSMPSLEEVCMVDTWEKIVQSARPWYLVASGSAASGDTETYVEDRVVLGREDVAQIAMAVALNDNVNPRVPDMSTTVTV